MARLGIAGGQGGMGTDSIGVPKNPIDAYEELKGWPDDRVVQELQAPTGIAPEYLVFSEARRRKEMRQRYRDDAAKMGEQQTSMIEEFLGGGPSSPPPPGGISLGEQALPGGGGVMPPPQMPPGGPPMMQQGPPPMMPPGGPPMMPPGGPPMMGPPGPPPMMQQGPPPMMPPPGMARGGLVGTRGFANGSEGFPVGVHPGGNWGDFGGGGAPGLGLPTGGWPPYGGYETSSQDMESVKGFAAAIGITIGAAMALLGLGAYGVAKAFDDRSGYPELDPEVLAHHASKRSRKAIQEAIAALEGLSGEDPGLGYSDSHGGVRTPFDVRGYMVDRREKLSNEMTVGGYTRLEGWARIDNLRKQLDELASADAEYARGKSELVDLEVLVEGGHADPSRLADKQKELAEQSEFTSVEAGGTGGATPVQKENSADLAVLLKKNKESQAFIEFLKQNQGAEDTDPLARLADMYERNLNKSEPTVDVMGQLREWREAEPEEAPSPYPQMIRDALGGAGAKREIPAAAYFHAAEALQKQGSLASNIPGAGRAFSDVVTEDRRYAQDQNYKRLAAMVPIMQMDLSSQEHRAAAKDRRLGRDLQALDIVQRGESNRRLEEKAGFGNVLSIAQMQENRREQGLSREAKAEADMLSRFAKASTAMLKPDTIEALQALTEEGETFDYDTASTTRALAAALGPERRENMYGPGSGKKYGPQTFYTDAELARLKKWGLSGSPAPRGSDLR